MLKRSIDIYIRSNSRDNMLENNAGHCREEMLLWELLVFTLVWSSDMRDNVHHLTRVITLKIWTLHS